MSDKIITDLTVLHQISRPTTEAEVKELNLLERLQKASLFTWTASAGLASIQIGVPVRFSWYIYKDVEYTLINPEIVTMIGKFTHKEGCLSIPHKWFDVERAWDIEYMTGGKKKWAQGFRARLIQHEIDHMNGKLISDI